MNTEIKENPTLKIYHPNGKGTGCAVSMTLHPATVWNEGYVSVKMANQTTFGNRNNDVWIQPEFGWDKSIDFDLRFNDLAKMLQVFRGECESIDDGRGLYFHRKEDANVKVCLRHVLDPIYGYYLESYEGDERRIILLTPSESLGLTEALSGSLSLIAFGRF